MTIKRTRVLLLASLLGVGVALTGAACTDSDQPAGDGNTSTDGGPMDATPPPVEASISNAAPQDATVSDADAGITCVGGPFPPQTPSGTCSLNSGQPLSLTFENNSARAISVYWVDYTCTEELEASLQPCEVFKVQSFVSHAWRLRDVTTGTLYKEFVPTSTAITTVTVQ